MIMNQYLMAAVVVSAFLLSTGHAFLGPRHIIVPQQKRLSSTTLSLSKKVNLRLLENQNQKWKTNQNNHDFESWKKQRLIMATTAGTKATGKTTTTTSTSRRSLCTLKAFKNDSSDEQEEPKSLRGRLRDITGFSFTAFRASVRATTGFSLTATRATLRAATGISITATMKALLSIFPTWIRYFIQPFLVMYYAPLMILRSWVGPRKGAKAEARASHENLVEAWKDAIRVAEAAQDGGYWPIHVNENGEIEASFPPNADEVLTNMELRNKIADAVAQSVEVAVETQNSE